jgi:lipopolysaccharide transport system permease protein
MTAALNVRFRDIKFALPFILQIWMFASPVFYPMEILSPSAMRILRFNPMTGIISGFRSAIFGTPFDWPLIGTAAIVTLLLLVLGVLVFKRMEDSFADHI